MSLIVGLGKFLIVFLFLLLIPSNCGLRFRWLGGLYLRMVVIEIVHECIKWIYFIVILLLLLLIHALLFKELLVLDVLCHFLS